jgi:threonine dehydrogenase-like Zn-dependent dehydrogenase
MRPDLEHKQQAPPSVRCFVITVSDSRTEETDEAGRLLRARLEKAGHHLAGYRLVRDEPTEVATLVRHVAMDKAAEVILLNGGTGIARRDSTFEAEAAIKFGASEWDGQQEVDVAFECAGVNDAVQDTMTAVRPGGRVILVGIPADDRTSFSASLARRKGLTIKLSRRMKHTYSRAIRLVESGAVDVRSLVTHRFPLRDIAEAFAVAQRREGLKVMIEPKA